VPIYVHQCKECLDRVELFRKIAEMDKDIPECCGVTMPRVICAPAVHDDMTPFRSSVDGSIINSRSDHRAHMKQHKLIEVGNEKLNRPATKKYEPKGVKEDLVNTLRDAKILS